MDSGLKNQSESDFKQLKELFPDVDSEMIAYFYTEQDCDLQKCMEYLLTQVPQANSENLEPQKATSNPSATLNGDELMAKALQELLIRNEETSQENIEKEIQKLSISKDESDNVKKEDISRDELIAQAIQTLLNRNEDISEENIEKEIKQIQTDVLLAYEIQFGNREQRRLGSERQARKEVQSIKEEEEEKPSEITIGIENFFREVGEGIKSTYAQITEYVEAKLEDHEDEAATKEESMKLLGDKDVEMEETNHQNRGSLSDEGFLDSGESLKEPIGLVSLKTGSLMFRESSDAGD